ncbi:hypothetical protein SMICM17S_00303 [Streptomyces microflavus]
MPLARSSRAAVMPAKPAPMTMTSYDVSSAAPTEAGAVAAAAGEASAAATGTVSAVAPAALSRVRRVGLLLLDCMVSRLPRTPAAGPRGGAGIPFIFVWPLACSGAGFRSAQPSPNGSSMA